MPSGRCVGRAFSDGVSILPMWMASRSYFAVIKEVEVW
jgi:hypothetical protein